MPATCLITAALTIVAEVSERLDTIENNGAKCRLLAKRMNALQRILGVAAVRRPFITHIFAEVL